MDAVRRTRELSIRVDIRVAETRGVQQFCTEFKENEYRLVHWSDGEGFGSEMEFEVYVSSRISLRH
jgi:hypothetical protein